MAYEADNLLVLMVSVPAAPIFGHLESVHGSWMRFQIFFQGFRVRGLGLIAFLFFGLGL